MGFGNAFALTPEPGTYYSMGGQVMPSSLYKYWQPYVAVALIRIIFHPFVFIFLIFINHHVILTRVSL